MFNEYWLNANYLLGVCNFRIRFSLMLLIEGVMQYLRKVTDKKNG